jgi:hypothetical protein
MPLEIDQELLLVTSLRHISAQRLSSYHKSKEEKEEVKGHNHPFNEKCGPHCPRNEHYKGPVKRPDFFHRKKQ